MSVATESIKSYALKKVNVTLLANLPVVSFVLWAAELVDPPLGDPVRWAEIASSRLAG